MPEVEEFFIDSGVRPGFPGNHGPGWYLVDYENRTIRPKPIEVVDTPPVEDTPSESHPSNNTEVLQQGGVISSPVFNLEAGKPELLVIPEGATLNPGAGQEGAEPAPSE